MSADYFAHESSYIDQPCEIGAGTKIWHFCHIMPGAKIGRNCSLGQNVMVATGVEIGDNVKIQNNVSLYTGVIVEDDVFLGPSCVLTNVINPRSQINRRNEYQRTLIRRGATIGANATIVCGATIGRYAFIGAGAVSRGDVPDYALMLGVPAMQKGWMGRHGYRLEPVDLANEILESGGMLLDGREFVGVPLNRDWMFRCPVSDWRYWLDETGHMRCLDWAEEKPLE